MSWPRFNPPGRFLALISVRNSVNLRDIVRLEGLGKLRELNCLIDNRILDLPAYSIVLQPTMRSEFPLNDSVQFIILRGTNKKEGIVRRGEVDNTRIYNI
jgi:hypothetical protein